MLKPDLVDTVIYHSPCTDGTGSAYVAWRYLHSNAPLREVKFIPGSYSNKRTPDVTGKNVLICDFSYRKSTFDQLKEQANAILIIDHHASAEKDLQDVPDDNKIFDMNHSGAYLVWKYFYPEEPVPLLIQYIQDRDIWTKEMPNTDAFFAWFQFYIAKSDNLLETFEIFDKYAKDDYLLMQMINTHGVAMKSQNDGYISQGVSHVTPKFIQLASGYYFVPHINTTVLKSDIGNQAFDKCPLIDFSVSYSINDKYSSTSFSLRSTNKHVDVSKIAFSLGGGGHRNASGAGVSYVTSVLPGRVIDDTGSLYWALGRIYYRSLWGCHVVYLNSSIHKAKLGRYLLQTKYVDSDGNPVQNCRAIYDSFIDGEGEDNPPPRDIAAIWEYNGVTDITTFTVVINPSLPKDVRESIRTMLSDKYPSYKEFGNVKFNGLKKDMFIYDLFSRCL